jgi:hypothetical protein
MADVSEVAAALLDACAPLMDIDWPCETCGGEGQVQTWNHTATPNKLNPGTRAVPCPDCVDGQTSPAVRIRLLIEMREAIGDTLPGLLEDAHTVIQLRALGYDVNELIRLRQVGRDA